MAFTDIFSALLHQGSPVLRLALSHHWMTIQWDQHPSLYELNVALFYLQTDSVLVARFVFAEYDNVLIDNQRRKLKGKSRDVIWRIL